MIIIDVTKNDAKVIQTVKLTSGTVGLKCQFNFSEEWKNLNKIAVCSCGNVTKDVEVESDEIVVPWEVMVTHGKYLEIGVYGSDGEGAKVIPTVYATAGAVCKGADPSGDEGYEPTPSIWDKILNFFKKVPYTFDDEGNATFHGKAESATSDENGNVIHDHYSSKEYVDEKIKDIPSTDINVEQFANALKGSISGEIVSMPDVSPIEHNIGVKVSGKNLFDPDKYIPHSGFSLIDFPIGKQLTISAKENLVFWVYYIVRDDNGGYVNSQTIVATTGKSCTFIMTQEAVDSKEVYVLISLDEMGIQPSIEELKSLEVQLEYGSVATPYTPYVPDITAVTLKKCGKNLIYPIAQTTTKIGVTYTNNGDGTITLSGKPTTTAYGADFYLGGWIFPKGGYRYSCLASANKDMQVSIREYYYDAAAGTWKIYNNNVLYDTGAGVTFTKNRDDTQVRAYIITGPSYDGTPITFYPQLEVGKVKTPYEPYTETLYTPNADGTVDGVKSLYPTTTLLTDIAGVTIEAEYNRDINKAFAKLEAAIVNM